MEIIDYGLQAASLSLGDTSFLFAEWKDDDEGKVYAHKFSAAEVGDELEYQGLCGTASVNHRGNAVCDMTDFPGYQPGEWATPAHVWSTLGPDQKEQVVRGLIDQLKHETK